MRERIAQQLNATALRNGNYRAACPWCQRKQFTLTTDGYRCRGCNARGSLETLAIYVPPGAEEVKQ